MSEAMLAALNPGQNFEHAGDTVVVVDTSVAGAGTPAKADRVEVDKTQQTVRLLDESNALIGFYPATVGSQEKPSPSGTLKVTEIDRNPIYRYNPAYRFKGVHSRKSFTIKPGPNNPVGTIWINLSADGYGIHGTPSPGKVSKVESHGCVRLTNWDAERVADRVVKGTKVAFIKSAHEEVVLSDRIEVAAGSRHRPGATAGTIPEQGLGFDHGRCFRWLRYEVQTRLARACPAQLQTSLGLATVVFQDCRNATSADFFISVKYWRAALFIARRACQASVASSHSLASRSSRMPTQRLEFSSACPG
jgi:lipoprotein-anchoring transpeptidase ErfK/SrfK